MVDIRVASPEEYRSVVAFYRANGYSQPIDPLDVVIVAEEGFRICGAARLVQENGVTVLRGMRVSEPWQGKGIGRGILERAHQVLSGCQCFCIPYRHLREFYGSIGFEEIEPSAAPEFLSARHAKYKQQIGLDVIIMAKRPEPREPPKNNSLKLNSLRCRDR